MQKKITSNAMKITTPFTVIKNADSDIKRVKKKEKDCSGGPQRGARPGLIGRLHKGLILLSELIKQH